MEQNKKKTIVKFILFLFLVLLFITFKGSCSNDKPKTKAEIAQQKKDSIIEVRTKKINLALLGFEKMVKEQMRDPNSYENIAKTYDKKDTANVVKMLLKFRGNNAFGGKTTTTVLANYYFNDDSLKITNQFNE